MSYNYSMYDRDADEKYFLENMQSNHSDAVKLRSWLDKVKCSPRAYEVMPFFSIASMSETEQKIRSIARQSSFIEPISGWEKLKNKEQDSHKARVINNTLRLVTALTETERPYYPPALAFFDENRALDLARCFKKDIVESSLSVAEFSYEQPRTDGYDSCDA